MSNDPYTWNYPIYKPDLTWTETRDWDNFTAGLTFINKLIQKLKPRTQAAYSEPEIAIYLKREI